MPGIDQTPLRKLKNLAGGRGIHQILLKDESSRCDLNAFKILGVSYAVLRLIDERLIKANSVLACATDGNHGRAVARVARQHGLRAVIYVHARTNSARIDTIKLEGAEVIVVDGNYDDSVKQAAHDSERNGWTVISDTSWPGYEKIPRYIMAGYTILMEEAVKQWAPDSPPDVVFVQAGVGGLLCAIVSWLCHKYGSQRPKVVSCEPTNAACLLESARAGNHLTLTGSLYTIMAGLSCGTPSLLAWPVISAAVDAFVSVQDAKAEEAMRILAHPIGDDPLVVAGESGACGLAALFSILEEEKMHPLRQALGLCPESRALVINTEGATDLSYYRRIITSA
jgi:diaminopropionate ammonia-lyase